MSTQAQILHIIKSTVKNQTGIDLNNPKTTTTTTPTAWQQTPTKNTSPINLGSLTSTQISSGLKEALNLGVTEGVKKLAVQDGFLKNEAVKILMPEKLRLIDTKLRALDWEVWPIKA